jgi:hypothetical protein
MASESHILALTVSIVAGFVIGAALAACRSTAPSESLTALGSLSPRAAERHNTDGATNPIPAPRTLMDMLRPPVIGTLLQYLDASDQVSVVVAWVAPWIGLTRSRAERRRSNQRRADRFHALRRRWGRPPSTPSSESSVE